MSTGSSLGLEVAFCSLALTLLRGKLSTEHLCRRQFTAACRSARATLCHRPTRFEHESARFPEMRLARARMSFALLQAWRATLRAGRLHAERVRGVDWSGRASR
jgi:hypothetical protein